jgi:cytochrome c2
MRSPSAKATGIALFAILLVLGIGGVAAEYVHERNQMWIHAAAITGGNPARGEALFIEYGCGGCHALRNVRKATGTVGPSLDGIALRTFVAGKLANNPENLQNWIRDPQKISPGTAMPDLRVGAGDARDINAFLYTRAK